MKMKKLLASVATLGSSFAVFADGGTTTTSGIVATSDFSDMFSTAQSNMAALIDVALPVAITFVGGGLVIWGAIALVSVLKRAFSAGKGR